MSCQRPGRFIRLLGVAAVVVAIDQWTKHWMMAHFALGESRVLLRAWARDFFALTYVRNTGTAFGMFQGNNGALLAVAAAILIGLLYAARGICERGGLWGFVGTALVLGGAIGNIIDRLRLGNVIDFLDFRVWPVFNVADSCICIGTFCIVVGLLRTEAATQSSEVKR